MNLQDVLKYELIGLEIEIVKSNNRTLEGLKGKILDESKNMFKIETDDHKIKNIIKNQVKIMINLNQKKYIIDGKQLVGRPEDRLKKR